MKQYLLIALALLLPWTAADAKRTKTKPAEPAPVAIEADDDSTFVDEPLSFDEMDSVRESMPEGLILRYENDTLFLSGNSEELPRRIIVVTDNGTLYYKQLPNDTSLYSTDHPPATSTPTYGLTRA